MPHCIKKNIALALVLSFIFLAFSALQAAEIRGPLPVEGQRSGCVVIKETLIQAKWYHLVIYQDSERFEINYFSRNFVRYYGVEVFKDGAKIKDTFKENDGISDLGN